MVFVCENNCPWITLCVCMLLKLLGIVMAQDIWFLKAEQQMPASPHAQAPLGGILGLGHYKDAHKSTTS